MKKFTFFAFLLSSAMFVQSHPVLADGDEGEGRGHGWGREFHRDHDREEHLQHYYVYRQPYAVTPNYAPPPVIIQLPPLPKLPLPPGLPPIPRL